ncbi:MAG: hypothetical protein C0592_10065 [Marinilabiliales bacterium]|nr:MAG: hypothetical protein C0592_10065 [Marinilabiliales bacterium]
MDTFTASENKSVYKFKIKRKELLISKNSVSFNNTTLLCRDIDKIKYGSTQVYVNGVKANKIFNIFLVDKQGNKIKISFQKKFSRKNTESPQDKLYQEIVHALWEHVTSIIANKMIDDLKNGKDVQVGKFRIGKKGITIRKFRLFKFKSEDIHIPWNKIRRELSRGGMVIFSIDNKYHRRRQQFLQTWNLNAMNSVLDFLWKDGRCYLLERGEL